MINHSILSKKTGIIKIRIEPESYKITIESSRLLFCSLNQIDEETLFANYNLLLGNSDNVKLTNNGKAFSTEEVKAFVTTQQNAWLAGQSFNCFSVYDKQHHQFIGTCMFSGPHSGYKIADRHNSAIEMGYMLDKPFWQQGYGSEIAKVAYKYIKGIVCFLAEEQRPEELVAWVDKNNTASVKILEKTLKNKEPSDNLFGRSGQYFFYKSLKKVKPGSELYSEQCASQNDCPRTD